MTGPDLIVHVGDERFGLTWDGSTVTILRKRQQILGHGGNTGMVCEWVKHDSGHIPAEVAAVISGYCAQKMANEATSLLDNGWHIGAGQLTKVYPPDKRGS